MATVDSLLGGVPNQFEHGTYHMDVEHVFDLRDLYVLTGEQRASAEGDIFWPRPDGRLADTIDNSGLFVGAIPLRSIPMGRIITAALATYNTGKDQEIWQSTGADLTDGINIHRLATDPNEQGRGYARSMLGYMSFRAAGTNLENIYLDCNARNQQLVEFYKSNGFEHIGNAVRPSNNYHAALFRRETAPYAQYEDIRDPRLRFGKMKRMQVMASDHRPAGWQSGKITADSGHIDG